MKQSETQSRRTCKLLPLTRRQKILRNLILILLAVCVLALRPQSEYVRTSDAALDRALNKQLGQDLQRSQEEFSKKYQEFMQQKDSLPAVIAERRQKELEDMMQRQEQFQAKAQQDMEKANNDLMAPVYKKLDDAIKAVGAAEGVIYIFDMARTPIPYVNEAQSINLTPKVKTQLGIK